MPTIRDFRRGDEAAIRRILEASLAVDVESHRSRAEVDVILSRIPADPSAVLLAEDDGEVVGYWASRFDDLTVHPDHRRRGHGRRLIEAALARAAERGETEIVVYVPVDAAGAVAFARTVGLRHASSLWLFRLSPDHHVPPPEIPADLVMRGWAQDENVDAFVAFATAAWEGHPTPLGLTPELARLVADLPTFDPAGLCIVSRAAAPDVPIAFTKLELRTSDDGRPLGWIGQVAVLPECRGLGLGRMLLRWGVRFLRERGAVDIELAVEASNDRALGLYRRTGFEPVTEWPHWSRAVQPGAGAASSVGAALASHGVAAGG